MKIQNKANTNDRISTVSHLDIKDDRESYILTETLDQSSCNELDEDAQQQNFKINSLPEEMLLEIFSYLDFDERLEARLVCQAWKDLALSPFNQVSFELNQKMNLTPDEAYFILVGTTSPWKHIVLKNFNASDYLMSWNFPEHLNQSLRTLTLQEGILNWSWILSIVEQLQSLQALTLDKSEGFIKVDMFNSWASTPFSDPESTIHNIDISQIFTGNGNGKCQIYYGKNFISRSFNSQMYYLINNPSS